MENKYVIQVGRGDVQRMDAMSEIFNETSLKWMNDHVGQANTLLDVGCGNGCLTVPFAQCHPHIRIIAGDLSLEQLDLAKAAAGEAIGDGVPNLSFVQLDARNLQLDEQFDVVHARFVLTNLPEPVAIATELMAAVKQGGRLVLQESNGFDFGALRDAKNPEAGEFPRAIQAWQHVVTLQHKMQGSSLDTGPQLKAHFPHADFATARCAIDTPSKKRLFIEGAKQALRKMQQLAEAGQPLPAEADPLVLFHYENGQQWLDELEQVQQDPAARFAWTVCCIAIEKVTE